MNKFQIGDLVEKRRGYKYPGEVRAVVKTLTGDTRYVVEALSADFRGMLHIFSEEQLKLIGRAPEFNMYEAFEQNAQYKSQLNAVAQGRASGFTGDSCNSCGSFAMVRSGSCQACQNCGATNGCS